MGAGAMIIDALKAVGSWVLNNPNVALDAVDRVAKIQVDKKAVSNDEHFQIVDEKLIQVGAATLELDQKIDTEIGLVSEEISAIRKQIHIMKTMLVVMGAVLGAAIIAIILLAIF